ncbi:hypothetical protein C4D60_Mb04t11450 [Musa balbisiana]|uniref:Uncharacterized protein n=1 Tax=Musa balbisiana TaxID=52838 RepID=A0A4S8KBA2_MUSBA|nr:hypothetical protein C4D60_Mb04t11450 [Musa balbisiana]
MSKSLTQKRERAATVVALDLHACNRRQRSAGAALAAIGRRPACIATAGGWPPVERATYGAQAVTFVGAACAHNASSGARPRASGQQERWLRVQPRGQNRPWRFPTTGEAPPASKGNAPAPPPQPW